MIFLVKLKSKKRQVQIRHNRSHKGDINIAPMITAVEFTLSPIDAITIAHAKIHKLEPLNEILDFTLSKLCACHLRLSLD
jgi:hypothetical protein